MKNAFAFLKKNCRGAVGFGVVLLLCSAGCRLFDPLPEGNPPEGAIVRNAAPQKFNVSSAVNYMTTSLSIHLLTNPLPENTLAVDADLATLPHALAVLEEISRVAAIQRKNLPHSQILKTRAQKNCWDFSLEIQGKTIWKEKLLLTLMAEKKVPPAQAEKGNK